MVSNFIYYINKLTNYQCKNNSSCLNTIETQTFFGNQIVGDQKNFIIKSRNVGVFQKSVQVYVLKNKHKRKHFICWFTLLSLFILQRGKYHRRHYVPIVTMGCSPCAINSLMLQFYIEGFHYSVHQRNIFLSYTPVSLGLSGCDQDQVGVGSGSVRVRVYHYEPSRVMVGVRVWVRIGAEFNVEWFGPYSSLVYMIYFHLFEFLRLGSSRAQRLMLQGFSTVSVGWSRGQSLMLRGFSTVLITYSRLSEFVSLCIVIASDGLIWRENNTKQVL